MTGTKGSDGSTAPNKAQAVAGKDGSGNLQYLSVNTSGELEVAQAAAAAAGLLKLEDAAHASGDAGVMGLSVRNDVLAALGGADGDYVPHQVNAKGALYVDSAPLASITSAEVAMVETTSTLIIAASVTRKTLIIRNQSNTAVELIGIGPTAATAAMFRLMPNKIGTTDVYVPPIVLHGFTGALYGFSESGTPLVEVIEILE